MRRPKWLAVMMISAMLFSLVPAMAVAETTEPAVPNYGFIPNSGEASVSKVDLVNMEEVARYYTAPRSDPAPLQWRTSRIAMDADGNAWVLNVGADGTNLQGSVVRIQADVTGLDTHSYPDPIKDFGTDQAVTVFPVGLLGEMPRAIAIDKDGFIWIGFYSGGYLAKYSFDGTSLTRQSTFRLGDGTANNIKFYEMKFAPDGVLWISSRNTNPARSGTAGIFSFDGALFTLSNVVDPYALLIADDGTVYATAYSNLLYIRDKDTGVWSTVAITGSSQNRGMAFDDLGNIWIASTVGTTGGTTIYSYNIASGIPGPTYTLTSGTTPVGVGKDAVGNMWAICRSDAMAQGWIEGFDPNDRTKVGAIQVGYRPYAYGDFIVPPPPTYEIAGYKFNADTDEGIAGWPIGLFKFDYDEEDYVFFANTTTDSEGKYSFTGLLAGGYMILEGEVPGWTPVGVTQHEITLPGDETLYPVDGIAGPFYDFYNAPPTYGFCGYKYVDGVRTEGWVIKLEVWDGDAFVPYLDEFDNQVTATTGPDGKYCFDGLPAGTYRASEVQQDGFTQVFPVPNEHIVVLPGGETPEGTILYGTQRANPGNNGLYEINIDAGTSTLLFNTGGSSNSPNGLGFDPVNKRLYYMYVNENAPYSSSLYFYDLQAGTETAAGLSLPGQVVVGASFFEGAYYYIPNSTADLHKVSLNPDGTVASDTVLWANFNGDSPAVYRFGDFAINKLGMLYASTNDTSGSTAEFFKLDVATGEYTLIADAATPNAALLLQVSFGSDGTLYGHAAGTGEFFIIDLAAGTKSSTGFVSEVMFSDLASGFQPYDFYNETEQKKVCQTAWATEVEGEDDGKVATSNPNMDVLGTGTAWGWNIGPLVDGDVVYFELWAAAGQNDLGNGVQVGEGRIVYDGDQVCVHFTMFEGFEFEDVHLWIGATNLPESRVDRQKNQLYTAAPGSFNYNDIEWEYDEDTGEYSFCVDASGDIYVALHLVACWYE